MTNYYRLTLIHTCYLSLVPEIAMSLCQYFSESLVNGKNKYTSCGLIRDLTVETASTSRHI